MIWRGGDFGQVREGDQVGPGQLFMKVADPSSMQVEAQANQAECAELRIGQPVVIRLDAFPGIELHGRVYSIGALAASGWMQQNYIRNIPVRIAIEDANPHLIPDLSAACDVLLERTVNALAIPLAAVREEHGRATVLVRNGGAFEERAVKLGARNDSRVAVLAGLQQGDEVRLN
jgi:HlyD family secretion protein